MPLSKTKFEDSKKLELLPIKISVQKKSFDLFKILIKALRSDGVELEDGDILAISSKFVAMSQGRIVKLSSIMPSKDAITLASKLHMSKNLAELVIREADYIFNGVPGFALTIKNAVVTPNAGVDRSNIFPGYAILHPYEPFEYAERLRKTILLKIGVKVGIVITDSRLMPTRYGTTGIALAASGFKPIIDERGRKDLFGNILRVTQRAVADDISAAAQLLMGEADESVPIVIVRNSGIEIIDRPVYEGDLIIAQDQCIYIRGLSNGISSKQSTLPLQQ